MDIIFMLHRRVRNVRHSLVLLVNNLLLSPGEEIQYVKVQVEFV